MGLVEVAVLGGIAGVVPLALRDRIRGWVLVAAVVAVSFALPVGPAAGLLAVTYPVAAALTGMRRLLDLRPGDWVPLVALGYAVAAGGALVCSRMGWTLLGTREPIVLLTAVHFSYAGVGATMLAGRARAAVLTPTLRALATVGLALAIGAPSVVALGFATGWALPQVGGAVLVTAGVWAVALVQLATARRPGPALGRALLVVSSLAVLGAMPLGVAWAAAQHWGTVPTLSVPALVRTHGMLNGVLFVPGGLLGWGRLVPSPPSGAPAAREAMAA